MAIYVEIVATKGSAPRDAGTAMRVTEHQIEGTIGGGTLEHLAIEIARKIMSKQTAVETQTIPLGPGLGQCCGGSVTLRFTPEPKQLDHPLTIPRLTSPAGAGSQPLWVWGAGHVGRAVIRQATRAEAFEVTWIDDHADRFPADIPQSVAPVVARDMPMLAARAPAEAKHLILTYSHEIDLALCAALLRRGFGFCGLIGSDTKWARFSKRLRSAGLDPSAITCPIGEKSRGKHPDAIAFGTLAGLLNRHPETESL